MNSDDHGEDRENKSRPEFRDVEDTYVFNVNIGLYEPKSYARQDTVNRQVPGTTEKNPLFTRSQTDWISVGISVAGLLISFATLVLLGFTVHYAHKQWCEAKRTADASIRAANTASNSLNLTRKVFKATQAARIDPTVTLLVNNIRNYIRVDFINSGPLPAKRLSAEVKITGVGTKQFIFTSVSKYRTVEVPIVGVADPKQYIQNPITVQILVTYRDGVGTTQDRYCFAVVVNPDNGSSYTQDCENN